MFLTKDTYDFSISQFYFILFYKKLEFILKNHTKARS